MIEQHMNVYTESQWSTAKTSITSRRPNVSVVGNSSTGYTTYINENYYFPTTDAKAGDILLTDGTNKFCTDQAKYNSKNTSYTPIGICAVPASLTTLEPDKYKTTDTNAGKARFVSLANMSCATPDSGDLRPYAVDRSNYMAWGGCTETTTNGTTTYDGEDIGVTSSEVNVIFNPVTGVDSTGIYDLIPSNVELSYSGGSQDDCALMCSDDLECHYCLNKTRMCGNTLTTYPYYLWPMYSPYGTSGKYWTRGFSSDLRGGYFTDLMIAKQTTTWTSSFSISSVKGHYPSACSCRRYTTSGTVAGDWYLPSMGELTVMFSRLKQIQEAFYLIGPSVSIPLGTTAMMRKNNSWTNFGYFLWSSSQFSSTVAADLLFYYSYTDYYYKASLDSNYRVRAFLAV